jgi:transmembrane sensor
MADESKVISFPDPSKVEAEAAEWVVILEDEELSDADLERFRQWRDTSEHHQETFKRLAALWGVLDRLEELEDLALSPSNQALKHDKPRVFALGFKGAFKLAAAAAALFGIAWTALILRPSPAAGFEQTYATLIGEQSEVSLPDGSELVLNTASQIEVQFTDESRNVVLVSGEAFFDVASDPARPFSVYANGGAVRAIGTAFSVRLRDDKIDVAVSEGQVALFSAAANLDPVATSTFLPASAEPMIELVAGQQVVFKETIETIDTVDEAALFKKLSWRDGMLSFSGDPLSEMIEEVSRYTETEIEIADEALRSLPIAGYFRAGEVDSVLEAVSLMADVEVERVSEQHVRLSLPSSDQ